MGVKYGEKREKADPKRIDRDHEREGEERYLAEDALPSILAAERKKLKQVSVNAMPQLKPAKHSWAAKSTRWLMTAQTISTPLHSKQKASMFLSIRLPPIKAWLTHCAEANKPKNGALAALLWIPQSPYRTICKA